MKQNRLTLAAAVAAGLLAAEAQASGILVARFGGEHGHPTTDNPTAMYYNPAGLSLGFGTRLYLDGNFAWRSVNYTRDPDAIDNPQDEGYAGSFTPNGAGVAANSGKASLFNYVASPFAAVTSDFGIKGFGAGIGFYVPFGGQSVWDDGTANDDFPGAVNGAQRWWVIEGTIRSLYVTGAAGYEIPNTNLSIGLGVNFVKSEINTVRARNADGTDSLRSGENIKEGRTLVDVSSNDISLAGGIIYRPNDQWWIGASYQSQPGFGENTLKGDARIVSGAAAVDDKKTKVELFQEMPDVIRLGARWRPTPLDEIRLFGSYVRWSVLKEQCVLNAETAGRTCSDAQGNAVGSIGIIPRHWEDAFDVRAGYSRWLDEDIEIFGGVGFDKSAVPDSTLEPSLLDQDKATVSLGGRFQLLDKSLAIGASYTQVIYFTVETSPRGRTTPAGGDRLTDLSGTPIREAARSPDAAGKYEQAVGVFNLNAQYTF
ncbi:MAG: outer membrane protein transport protein [bacterium]